MKNGLLESARGLSWPKTAGTKEGLRISRVISFIPNWMAVYCRSHRPTSSYTLEKSWQMLPWPLCDYPSRAQHGRMTVPMVPWVIQTAFLVKQTA